MPKYFFAMFNLVAIILLGYVTSLASKSKNKDRNIFLVLIIFSALSNFVYFAYLLSNNFWLMKVSQTVILMLEDALLLSLLAFTNSYTGHKRNTVVSTITIWLVIADVISLFVNIFTNYALTFEVFEKSGYTYLLINAKWPYVLHQILSYGMFFLTMLLLIYESVVQPVVYKIKYSSILICTFITIVVNGIAYILRFIVNPSIFMYSIIATVIYFLSFKYTPSVLIDKIQGIIIEDMNDVLVIFDNCGKLLYTNKKGKELALLGKYDKNDVCLNDIEKYCQDHIDRFNNSLLSISYNNQVLYFDIETNEIKDYKKRLQASVYLFHDVTLRETEKRLRTYETSHDDVTGIYNRRYFLEQASKIYNTCKDKYDILVTNFEGFRVVNEMLGVDGGKYNFKTGGECINRY